MAGNDINLGVDAITRAALSPEFEGKSGAYFDQDARGFGPPHPEALDPDKCAFKVAVIEKMLIRMERKNAQGTGGLSVAKI